MPGLLVAALVVVPLGLLLVERRLRRRFIEDNHVFGCRVRALGRPPRAWRRLRRRWSRLLWARWDDAVLVIRRGPLPGRTLRLHAQVTSLVYLVTPDDQGDRGIRPVAARLVVEGSGEIEVSTLEASRIELVGPYLVAASRYQPAPARRREI